VKKLAPAREGHIYAIRVGDFIRVGFSVNVKWRLYAWWNNSICGTPFGPFALKELEAPVEFLGVFPGSTHSEHYLHKRMRHEQIELNPEAHRGPNNKISEWYPVGGEMHKFICSQELSPVEPRWYRQDYE
jgi:hypothetical protein